jgi:hypothetical protein
VGEPVEGNRVPSVEYRSHGFIRLRD